MLEHTNRQVHKWKFLQHGLSRDDHNRSLFVSFPHFSFSTFLIFHMSHFPHSSIFTHRTFHTRHFPHSSFSILVIFHTPHFPHFAHHVFHTIRKGRELNYLLLCYLTTCFSSSIYTNCLKLALRISVAMQTQ